MTTKDFLMAGGKMGMLPTAMSLFATLCSASTILGIPVEIYYLFSWLIASFLTSHIFIPKFRELGFISIYTYLEKRFSLALRISVTLTFIITCILFMSVILYGPCLALSQVTGLHIWLAIISCGVICTFYTSIGGMKAVIWTDVAQSFVIFVGVILSIVFGFIDAGGVKKVVETVIIGQRINFSDINFDPNLYPLFVLETFNRLPGLTGLFIASVMSGSLSTISSGVNSISAVTIEDIWKPLMTNKLVTDEKQAKISKYISIVLGLLTMLFAFLMSYLTNILVIAYSIMGALAAPIFGVFLLGFFFPRVNSRVSALVAFLTTLLFQIWVLVGANFTRHQQSKRILPISIDGCISSASTNVTINLMNIEY
ncbi:hypothetical protein I4U23_022858 [Adineta vaga]|nr:hypothetical protein I4U23_022858 [Adineta vaga]